MKEPSFKSSMRNSMTKAAAALALCTIGTSSAFAQQKLLKGTVVDSNGEPLIGVNVSVKGTTIGIITDMDGKVTVYETERGYVDDNKDYWRIYDKDSDDWSEHRRKNR